VKKMETKRIGSLLIVGLVVLSVMVVVIATAAAQPKLYATDPIMFEGYITDAGGNGISGVQVDIKRTVSMGVYTWSAKEKTDKDGYFKTPKQQIIDTQPVDVNGIYKLYLDNVQVKEKNIGKREFDDVGNCIWSHSWTHEIPEFSTIVLPVASILGLLFFFNRRKHRKE
jgi:hypothetical protein